MGEPVFQFGFPFDYEFLLASILVVQQLLSYVWVAFFKHFEVLALDQKLAFAAVGHFLLFGTDANCT